MKKFLKGIWKALGPFFSSENILKYLKSKIFTELLKKLLSSGGIKGFIIKYIAENLFDEIVVPVTKIGLVKIKYVKDDFEGELNAKALDKARLQKNPNAYDTIVDDIFTR